MEHETHPPIILYTDLLDNVSDVLLSLGYLFLAITSISYLWKTSGNPFTSMRNASFALGFGAIAYAHYILRSQNYTIQAKGYYNEINESDPHISEIIKFGNVSILCYAIISIIQTFLSMEPDLDTAFVQKKILSKHAFLNVPIDAYGTFLSHILLVYAIFIDKDTNVSAPFFLLVLVMMYNTYHASYEGSSIMKNISMFGNIFIIIGYAIILGRNIIM